MTKESATSKAWTQTLDPDLQNHVTVNETGAFGIPADKGNRGQYFLYNLPFCKQPVYKQTVLAC